MHHIACNYQNGPIGGKGCICVVITKKEQKELEAINQNRIKSLVIDKNNILWQISEVNEITVYHGKAPNDAKVILGDFDGFNTTYQEFLKAFGIKNNMRITEQSTVYELTITELKAMMSKELGVSESKIEIRFKQNDKETYGVEVVVTGPIPNKGTIHE